MTKAMSFAVMLVVLIGALLAAVNTAEGASRWRRSRRIHTPRVHTPQPTPRATQHPSTRARYTGAHPSRYYYPKYTGGFHARYYNDLPGIYGSGPMRGTAW